MKPRGILVNVPSVERKFAAETSQSLYNLAAYLTSVGIPHQLTWTTAADIEDIRNLEITRWYDGHPEFSHLLFIDADMGFPCDPEYGKPNLIRDMIKFDKPLMGCFYAKRNAAPGPAVGVAQPHSLADVQHGFLRAESVGCGVMMISREVITTMLEKIPHISGRISGLLAKGVPDLKLGRIIGAFDKFRTDERMLNEVQINNELLAALGRSETLEQATGAWMEALKVNRMNEGRRLSMSEDASFCYRWTELCGGEIWAAVKHRISHVGPFNYALRYQDVLEAQISQEVEAAA